MTTAQSDFSTLALANNQLLSALLTLHTAGLAPEREFIEANASGFKYLWERGFSNYQIYTMASGRIRFRAAHQGVLTRKGVALAGRS